VARRRWRAVEKRCSVASTRAVAQRAAALAKGGSARQKNDVLWLELRAVA